VLRHERRILGTVTMILGLMSLVVWAEQTFRIESLVFNQTPFPFARAHLGNLAGR
jgi:hypothetical protein